MQWQPKQLTTMVNELQNQREANDTSTSLDLRNKFHRNLHVHERKRGKKQILGEIIGATNLAAALRKKSQEAIMQEQYSEHSEKPSISPVYDSFCEVYWDGKVIHRTKTVYKSNNPIWACDTGSLFKLDIDQSCLLTNASLRIKVYHKAKRKADNELIGFVAVEGANLLNESWCDESRKELELIQKKTSMPDYSDLSMSNEVRSFIPDNLKAIFATGRENDLSDDERFLEDDERDDTHSGGRGKNGGIDDDYIFGEDSMLALRFRVATEDDMKFLKTIDDYIAEHRSSRDSLKPAYVGVENFLDGKRLAHLVTEGNNASLAELLKNFNNFRLRGRRKDNDGMTRIRVKPGPDPNKPSNETMYLSEQKLLASAYSQSTNWIEAGSGELGIVAVEIISCQGLSNKDFGRALGNKSDPFVCVIFENCLVETDVIQDCLNPLWPCWSQRSFILNREFGLSSLYLGVFDHDTGPWNHQGCGRVTIDLQEFEENTIYTLKYHLYSSTMVSDRKPKGSITIRLQLINKSKRKAFLSLVNPPTMYINVKKRKTLSIARYTLHGKHREDVYNMKVLKSLIDELLEYLQMGTYEINSALDSVLFWRGQVTFFGKISLPLHSSIVFCSAVYVLEYPRSAPSFLFFSIAYCMLIQMNRRKNEPSPWFRCKPFTTCITTALLRFEDNTHGTNIDSGDGIHEKIKNEENKKKKIEEDKRLQENIAAVRRELQQILSSLGDLSLHTNEDGASLNPLKRLLPVQLLLKDIIYYFRLAKTIVCCDNSILSTYIICICIVLGLVLMVIPWSSVLHLALKVVVYVFLGPWMKIVDILYQRRNSKRMKRFMREIKEREKKMWEQARLQKEEAMKLKAARILRFGRFAVKVPILNFPRYRDYPLPDSIARSMKSHVSTNISNVSPKKFIPGQKHVGVMVPGLEFGRQWERDESWKINELKSSLIAENASCCTFDCLPTEVVKEHMFLHEGWTEEGAAIYDHQDFESLNDELISSPLRDIQEHEIRDDNSSTRDRSKFRYPQKNELLVMDSLLSNCTE